MSTPTDAELEDYMLTLHEAEAEGARQEIAVGPYTAMIVIGALQLATRHPGATAYLRAEMLAVIDQFRPWFAGTPGEHIIDRGNNNPAADQ